MTMSGDNLKNLILQARSTAWQYKLEDYTDEALKTIGKTVRKAENDLFRELKHIDFRLPEGREHAVLSELNDLTFGIQAKLTGDIREAAAIAGQASIHEYGQILSFDGRLAETVGFNSVALSPAQLNAMVNVPIGGNLLNTWIQDSFKAHIVDGIHDEIKAGQLRGMSTDRIIKRLQDSFGMIKKDAESIARTSLSSINNAAAEKVYKENSDIVKTETWSASLEVGSSGRSTCLACAVNDGRVYPIDEPHIRPPLHIRCRCFMLPNTVSWRELGLDIDEMQKVARPYTERGANREILSGGQHKGGFESFLKGQSKKYQEDLLGPNRYRMWKDGKIKWENLADRDGNLILLKRGKDGGYDGLMPNRNKYVTPVDKPVKPPPKTPPPPIPKPPPVKPAPVKEEIIKPNPVVPKTVAHVKPVPVTPKQVEPKKKVTPKPVPPVKDTFVPAKNIKGAEKWCKEKIIIKKGTCDLSSLLLVDDANAINRALFEEHEFSKFSLSVLSNKMINKGATMEFGHVGKGHGILNFSDDGMAFMNPKTVRTNKNQIIHNNTEIKRLDKEFKDIRREYNKIKKAGNNEKTAELTKQVMITKSQAASLKRETEVLKKRPDHVPTLRTSGEIATTRAGRIKNAVQHEIGHLRWYETMDHNQKSTVRNLYGNALKKDLIYSQYAKVSAEEYFAESYTLWRNGGSDFVDKDMVTFLSGVKF